MNTLIYVIASFNDKPVYWYESDNYQDAMDAFEIYKKVRPEKVEIGYRQNQSNVFNKLKSPKKWGLRKVQLYLS